MRETYERGSELTEEDWVKGVSSTRSPSTLFAWNAFCSGLKVAITPQNVPMT